MAAEPIRTDLVIVGAGPVGLFAVFEAGLLGLKCHLVDALDRPGGQCAELYPEKPIFDIPALPRCSGQELVDRLMEQAGPFAPRFHLNQQARALEPLEDGGWRLSTTAGTVLEAPALCVAAGAGCFVPRPVALPEAAGFEGKSLFYAVRGRERFRGKNVVVAGGGDSALDWALDLHAIAASVTIVHRRDEFRAAPDSIGRMRLLVERGALRLVVGEIKAMEGEDGRLQALRVKEKSGGETAIPADALLAFYGLKSELGPLAEWGLAVERSHVRVSPDTMETNRPGLFAIGDIADYPGKLKLILCGFHEAALMAHRAREVCRPDERYVFRYTTSSIDLHKKLGIA
ncbi:MAG: NAD(P)/FAD-dependent oxidoreductase [Geminicoccaceae bacterium]|nr:NAD(P)/FAD-dependent oxidoreductase [Geminicoccaceae bacterium]